MTIAGQTGRGLASKVVQAGVGLAQRFRRLIMYSRYHVTDFLALAVPGCIGTVSAWCAPLGKGTLLYIHQPATVKYGFLAIVGTAVRQGAALDQPEE